MLNVFYRPWLHFIVLGTCLFLFWRWYDPPPRPVVGPLSESRIENLKRQWFATAGRVPAPEQVQRMAAAELDRDILFQEALSLELHRYDTVVRQRLIKNMRFLRMGDERSDDELYADAMRMELHLGDEVVKRRMIQMMEQILLAQAAVAPPTEKEIADYFEQHKPDFKRPPRFSIEHVFLTRDREPEMAAVLDEIRSRQLDPEQARTLSSPFLPGYRFNAQSPAQLARHFGAGFVLNLETTQPQAGNWVGPVESTYGYHLVWVAAIEAARDARLEEVHSQISRDLLLAQRNSALRDAVAQVRENYEVIL